MSDTKTDKGMLVIGIGNNGRGDDALGWKVIDALVGHPAIETDYRYQLQIEDADVIKDYQTVVFVDASLQPIPEGFAFYACKPENTASFTTHAVAPGDLLWLCQELYGSTPQAYVLGIAGEYWELHQGLSTAAQDNFERAMRFFKEWLKKVPQPTESSYLASQSAGLS